MTRDEINSIHGGRLPTSNHRSWPAIILITLASCHSPKPLSPSEVDGQRLIGIGFCQGASIDSQLEAQNRIGRAFSQVSGVPIRHLRAANGDAYESNEGVTETTTRFAFQLRDRANRSREPFSKTELIDLAADAIEKGAGFKRDQAGELAKALVEDLCITSTQLAVTIAGDKRAFACDRSVCQKCPLP